MSDIDYEQLREDIISYTIEANNARTREEAETWLQEKIKSYDEHLWLMNTDARLRNIAQQCGIQPGIDIEEITTDPSVRTIASLESQIPQGDLIIEAKIINVSIRTTNAGKKIAELTISDGTGVSRISLWEQEAEGVENGELGVGDIVRIYGAYTSKPYSDYGGIKVDIKKRRDGRIEKNPDGLIINDKEPSLISELADGMNTITLTAMIQKIFDIRQTANEKEYITMNVSDKAGNAIFLKVWKQNLVDMVSGSRLREGDIANFTYLRVNSWQGKLGVNTTNFSEFILQEDENQEAFPQITFGTPSGAVAKEKFIFQLKNKDRAKLTGKIIRIYDSKPYYDSCPNPDCLKGIKKRDDGTLFCPKGCVQINELPSIPVARCSGLIADGTGTLRFTAMGEAAEKVIGIDAVRIKEEFDALYASSSESEDQKKTKDASKTFIEVFSDEMMQGFVSVVGNVKIDNNFRGTLEMMIYTIEPTDYDKEAKVAEAAILEIVQEPAKISQ